MVGDSVAIAMRNCIIYFLNRRRETVVQIMIERRAPLLKHFGVDKTLKIDLEPYCREFYENQEAYTEQQRGIWRAEWEHYFHGHGCRLTHIQTKEYFDWDASDPRYFRAWEFIHHLQWKIRTDPHNSDIAILREQGLVNSAYRDEITKILDRLVREGILTNVPNEFGERQLKLSR
jgi:hypothetical protein